MAQDRLVQNADGSVTLIYANGAKQTVPASNKAGLLQLAERVPAEQIDAPVLDRIRSIDPQAVPKTSAELRTERVTTLRSELENQYNNLVKADPRLTYAGRQSDLPAIFNQQAQQLADAGVTSVANLRNQDGRLIDSSTGKPVNTTNLGGQIAIDRDTGAQKFGDIFSGVQGGANYGIQFAPDGTPILFPVHEKSKSLYQQVVGSDLFKVASLALAAYGVYNLATAGAAGGASAGSAATSGAASGGGSAISGAGLTSAEMAALKGAAAYGEGATAAQIAAGAAGAGIPAAVLPLEVGQQFTPVPGSFQEALPGLGVETQASAGGFTAAPGSFQAALPSLGIAAAPSLAMNLPSQTGSLLTVDNALNALEGVGRLGGLLGGPQQQGLIGGGGMMQTPGRAPGGVDYSELLKSLTRQASVPGVAPLIGPIVQPQESLLGMQVQPVQYQPLNRSLLG